ncbi:MAG: MoaD/ThiS family protein [Verrucomicrobia bacterium]|nr:MoaD/ThiS family protein [Verrucomicrobiota bacterium]
MSKPAYTAVVLLVPGPLRNVCRGAAELRIPATSVREALLSLERHHPDFHRCICDETGAVRRHINIFINNTHMRDCQGLETPLRPGDTLIVLPAVSDG